jgi:hypothetical protein
MSTIKISNAPAASNPYLSKSYVDGVYIPSGLVILGCLIVKREWLPYAVALALALGGYKVYSMSTDLLFLHMPQHVFGTQTNGGCRSAEGAQAGCLPKLRAHREDYHLAQCGHVSTPSPTMTIC